MWQSADPELGKYLPTTKFESRLKFVSEPRWKWQLELPGEGGVFTSANLGLYSLTQNDPLLFIDPDGRVPVNATGAFGEGLGIYVSYTADFQKKEYLKDLVVGFGFVGGTGISYGVVKNYGPELSGLTITTFVSGGVGPKLKGPLPDEAKFGGSVAGSFDLPDILNLKLPKTNLTLTGGGGMGMAAGATVDISLPKLVQAMDEQAKETYMKGTYPPADKMGVRPVPSFLIGPNQASNKNTTDQ